MKQNFGRSMLWIMLMALAGSVYAQSEPRQVVEAQLNAYNQGDLDAFIKTFDQNVVFTDATGKTTMEGLEEVKARYKAYFEASPELHSDIQKRIVQGNFVIDHEYITGRYGNPEIYELVLVFEVRNKKIVRVTVYGK